MRIVSENEFAQRFAEVLCDAEALSCGVVTGPGRSGAIASVYASYMLRIPFIPFGVPIPEHIRKVLIVDTATKSGKTIRKAARRYQTHETVCIAAFVEPPRVVFWYEGIDE